AFVFACGASVCATAKRTMPLVMAVEAFEDAWQRRKSRSFHPEAGLALVGAGFAAARPAPSDMRAPVEIHNATPPANAAVQAVKSDIRDRINAFMMSSDQSARTASMRDSLG